MGRARLLGRCNAARLPAALRRAWHMPGRQLQLRRWLHRGGLWAPDRGDLMSGRLWRARPVCGLDVHLCARLWWRGLHAERRVSQRLLRPRALCRRRVRVRRWLWRRRGRLRGADGVFADAVRARLQRAGALPGRSLHVSPGLGWARLLRRAAMPQRLLWPRSLLWGTVPLRNRLSGVRLLKAPSLRRLVCVNATPCTACARAACQRRGGCGKCGRRPVSGPLRQPRRVRPRRVHLLRWLEWPRLRDSQAMRG
mmetsp:Transcript_44332/g.100139  ORF Transcript_44332/g.100139 Transcript_44332/m.100139 type:complete len:253 (+) Transcript_44332:658-1416(+)